MPGVVLLLSADHHVLGSVALGLEWPGRRPAAERCEVGTQTETNHGTSSKSTSDLWLDFVQDQGGDSELKVLVVFSCFSSSPGKFPQKLDPTGGGTLPTTSTCCSITVQLAFSRMN